MSKMTKIIERYQTEQFVLSCRKTPTEKEFRKVFIECNEFVADYIEKQGEIMTDLPFVIFYDYLFMDSYKIDVEICFPVSKLLPPTKGIVSRVIPPGRIIFSMHSGPYQEIPETYGKMTQWIMEKGYEPEGYSYEYYFNETDSPYMDTLVKVVIPYKETRS